MAAASNAIRTFLFFIPRIAAPPRMSELRRRDRRTPKQRPGLCPAGRAKQSLGQARRESAPVGRGCPSGGLAGPD